MPPDSLSNPESGSETDSETGRLETLRRYSILDTPPEANFDRITALAAQLFNVPIALIALVDESRVWIKSSQGIGLGEMPRHGSICCSALGAEQAVVVLDGHQDGRFGDRWLGDRALGQPQGKLRFYAGAPLRGRDGYTLGTLCLIDTRPRASFDENQQSQLADLAAMVVDQLDLRLAHAQLSDLDAARAALQTEQEMLRALIESGRAGIVACDRAGRLTLVNQTARDLLGLPDQPPPFDQWASYCTLCAADGTPLAAEAAPLLKALGGDRIDGAEMIVTPKGGPTRTVLVSGQAIAAPPGPGPNQGAIVVMHDITERKQIETTLRASEARLSSIFETIPDGILMFDRQGYIVAANSAAEAMLRLSREELAQRTYGDLPWTMVTPSGQPLADAPPPLALVAQKGEAICALELAITHADGTRATLCLNASPLLDAKGTITHVVASLNDITERKLADLALQASEERYRSVIETTAEGIVLQHADGTIYTCNASAAQILGLTPDQMMGRTSIDPRWSAVREDGSPFPGYQHPAMVTLRTGEPQTNVVMGVHKPDGTLTWISINTRPLFKSDDEAHQNGDAHRPLAVVASFFDITDRKLAEAERAQLIREQTARLDAEASQFRSALLVNISTTLGSLLNHTDTLKQVADRVVPFFADWCAIDLLRGSGDIERVAVAHCDPAKVDLGWQIHRRHPPRLNDSEGIAKILRHGQTELVSPISATMLEAVARDPEHLRLLQDLGLTSCIVAPLIARGQTLGAISFITAESDRCYRPTDLALAENIAHQVAIAIDNARLYQAEQIARSEAESANRIKDEFLAVLSHELRSPLNPILGWSQLLQKQQPDPAILARGLETIERNAKLQTQLIADLLDVSRILQGKLSLEVGSVDLKTTLEAAMETVHLAAAAKAIVLHTDFYPTLPPVVGDAGRLQQVVWNLLANAIKFTPEGGQVNLGLALVHSAKGGSAQAQITVADTGKGIDPEFIPHIFERFRQADSKTTRRFGGLGLGLAIARQLVELHGGTIAAASPGEDQGATFTVRLPLQRRPGAVAQAVATAPEPPPSLVGVSVLVVEDETDARELLVLVLEQAGATVTAAASGEAALGLLPDLVFDILISDIAMPDMDGYTLVKQIRARRPGHFQAIALTAYAGEIDQKQAIAAGFQRHLSKPFEPEALVAAIVVLLKPHE